MKLTTIAALAFALGAPAMGAGDDFQREPRNRDKKDPLEGKPAPALQVTGWMNTGGEALTLESLRGKVVVLDFWGTW